MKFRHLLDFWYVQARLARINYWYVVAAVVAVAVGWGAFERLRIEWMDFDSALQIYDERDYDTAIQVFRRLAEDGDASAQMALGFMYWHGNGVQSDEPTAVEWLLKAAEQGNAFAMGHLADIYAGDHDSSDGQHQPDRRALAVEWYRRAAEAGNTRAQRRLGAALIGGVGVEIDRDAGVAWIMRAIDTGNEEAMYDLAQIHEQGQLGAKDVDLALHWYLRAARRGHLRGTLAAIRLLEDEQSPLYDLEKAYLWARIGSYWWRYDPIYGRHFGYMAQSFLREQPQTARRPDHALVNMGVMDEQTYQELIRAYEEALGTPESWPSRMDEESRLRAEATAAAVLARWPDPPIDDDAPL